VDHGGLVAAIDRVRLRARGETNLYASPDREILAGDNVEGELQVLVPVVALFICDRRARNVKRKLHHRAIDASAGNCMVVRRLLDGVQAGKVDVIVV
jgi:hypothetical protein